MGTSAAWKPCTGTSTGGRATLFTRMYMFGMRAARDKQSFEGAQQTLKTARERQDHGMFHVWMTRAIPEDDVLVGNSYVSFINEQPLHISSQVMGVKHESHP